MCCNTMSACDYLYLGKIYGVGLVLRLSLMIFLDFLLLWRIEQHFNLYNRKSVSVGLNLVKALFLWCQLSYLKIHFMLSFIMMSSGEQFCLLSLAYSDFLKILNLCPFSLSPIPLSE